MHDRRVPAPIAAPPAGYSLLDLHNHTRASFDGFVDVADYQRAFDAGRFQVLALTDHNRIDGALRAREQARFPVIVGMEVDTADGELIGLFLERPVAAGQSALATAEAIREQGGLVYLQHPFYPLIRRPLTAPARERLVEAGLVDIVEGLNGGPFQRRYDVRARAFASEHGLPLGAGSDAHDPPGIGRCAVAVPPGDLDPRTLPARLRDGVLVDRRRSSWLQLATKARCFVGDEVTRLPARRARRPRV